MKNSVKISILTATVAVAIMFLGGCKKDTGPELVSGKFTGSITINCESGGATFAWAVVGKHYYKQVDYSSNKFSFGKLPDIDDEDLIDVEDFFENTLNISGKLTYSNKNVRINNVSFIGLQKQGTQNIAVGKYINATDDDKTICIYVYVDDDVKVTGGNNIAVMLEEGWNRIYFTRDGKNNKFSTKEVEGLKWFFTNELD